MAIKAALDIGSSSVKLLVLNIGAAGDYTILAEESRVTGLGQGVSATRLISAAAMEATLDCLREMVAQARSLGAETFRAAGTDALRRAENRGEFFQQAQRILGISVTLLSGQEEARLSRVVALRELPAGAADVVFFDVGGGSTELTWCVDGELRAARSIGLGARRCTELAGVSQPVSAEMRERLVRLVDGALSDGAPHPPADGAEAGAGQGWSARLAGLGGTASQLVWLLQGQRGEAWQPAHGATVQAVELRALLDRLAPLGLDAVKQLTYMDPARAEMIFAGLTIIDGLLRFYDAPQLTVIDRGLRYGLLLA
jgi:exopolyphosphatase / guanosine-5'-triphosphate,3'-diphosphate pyrophosphatase